MTREEAIDKYANAACELTSTTARLIDGLIALGMLKLDEKESIALCSEDHDWNWWLSQTKEFKAAAVRQIRTRPEMLLNVCAGIPYLATTINETIDKAGLKIVEK